jgi:hypothetical protein
MPAAVLSSFTVPKREDEGLMDIDHIRALQRNDIVRKRLAKLMALRCFRNTKLEDFHAGVFPSSETRDYSDVKVVSPYGEIPWDRVARLSDDEMRTLVIDVVNRCYAFITELFDSPRGSQII